MILLLHQITLYEEKQSIAIEDAAKKQTNVLQDLNTDQQLKSMGDFFSKASLTAEARHELEKIKKIKQEINRDDLIYKNM